MLLINEKEQTTDTTTWMDLKDITLSEPASQDHMLYNVRNIFKMTKL